MLSEMILQLGRGARTKTWGEFQGWALEHAASAIPFHSASWVCGVMSETGPVFHDVFTIGLKPGYWQCFMQFAHIDPTGPKMFSTPGRSFLHGLDDFPLEMVQGWLVPYGVNCGITGMICDPSTGQFSVVCLHRDATMPSFSEAERQLHENLLPHWIECLNMNRVDTLLRLVESGRRSVYRVGIVDSEGLIHFAQQGFGESIHAEWPSWKGGALPEPLIAAAAQDIPIDYRGINAIIRFTPTSGKLKLVRIRNRERYDSLTQREQQILELLFHGLTVKDVARDLEISPSTVDNLRSGAYLKLGVSNRTELARIMEAIA